jgi:hypothetical protein
MFWSIARVMGIAAITAGGVRLLIGALAPKPADLVAGAVHFRKGVEEFQKGLSSVFCGSSAPSPDKVKQQREATRISIE